MGGILILIAFELCGLAAVFPHFRACGRLTRAWLGLCLGLAMMMTLPSAFAFALDFTRAAQGWALGAAFFAAIGSCAARLILDRRAGNRAPGNGLTRPEKSAQDPPYLLIAALVLPMMALSGYLQYTHMLREAGGALYVGQSTYGDLCLHLGIATGLKNAAYPPTYTLIQGVLLGYPFLSDAMVTTMLLFGTELSSAFAVTGTLMMGLVYLGFAILAWTLTRSKLAVTLSYLLLFLNGGLGFFYALDGVFQDATALKNVFTGFYLTPTNMPDLNLRWVNVICDLLLPQRTLLAGWMMLMPALYLLTRALREKRRSLFLALGFWAGLMPMVHTHTYLALGLISLGAMPGAIFRLPRGERLRFTADYLFYGALAIAMAAPQLMLWTFPQTAAGGALSFRFNWVNTTDAGRMIDGYFWFWLKNVGPVYLLLVPAALSGKRVGRAIAAGCLLVYAVAELIQFQPNPYDNNKLFYVAFIAMLPLVGRYLKLLWDRMKGVRGRALFLGVFLSVSCLSGAMSVGRETVSSYLLFSRAEADAGAFISAHTPDDAVILTGQQHNNPVSSLAGRQIVCGTGSYLYYHGIDFTRQQLDSRLMYADPAGNTGLFEQYGVDYVYLSSYERGDYNPDEAWFDERTVLVYSNFDVRLYAVSDRAKRLFASGE